MNKKRTKVLKINPNEPDWSRLDEAADILSAGGLVAFPTETVYGLAALINDSLAVEKLRHLKNRDGAKKFSLCIYNIKQAEEFVPDMSPFVRRLIKRFWPGPLTLVLKSQSGEFVGLRMPDHPVALELLKKLKTPIFAPSANFAGEVPPVCAEDVLRELDGLIDAVIDSGRTRVGISSTVCRVENDKFDILREGAASREEIEAIYRKKEVLFVCTGNSCRSPMAEGMFRRMVEDYPDITVSSAGVAAFDGMPATPEAVEVMQKRGIDNSEQRARRLNADMIGEADFIIVMEERQKNMVVDLVKNAAKRTFLLKEFTPEGMVPTRESVPDPIGMNSVYYEQTADLIKEYLERLVKQVK